MSNMDIKQISCKNMVHMIRQNATLMPKPTKKCHVELPRMLKKDNSCKDLEQPANKKIPIRQEQSQQQWSW